MQTGIGLMLDQHSFAMAVPGNNIFGAENLTIANRSIAD